MENIAIIETQKRLIGVLAANAREAVVITDPQSKITHFNKAAEEITGYKAIEVLNKPIGEFLEVEDPKGSIQPEVFCPTSEIDVDGIIYDGHNVRLSAEDGNEKIVNLRSVKIKKGKELNIGCVVFIENTFEQAEFERMRTDFIGLAEHILRTPATIIRGYLSRLMQAETIKKLDEKELDYINASFSASNDLISLIEDLFSIANIHKKTFKIDAVELDLEGVVTKVVAKFRGLADQKNISIGFVPPIYKLPKVKADVLKVQMILSNLLENALKFTDQGSIRVSLTKAKEKDFVIVMIQDSGYGIPKERVSYIFDKFYQVKNKLEMKQGLGLGLYIAKKLVEAHGGEIWVESKEKEGSTFYFSLPVAK
ncbi:ATP-binding protein [Patescibacteria group bacterium]